MIKFIVWKYVLQMSLAALINAKFAALPLSYSAIINNNIRGGGWDWTTDTQRKKELDDM
jgi:hypothetical protein